MKKALALILVAVFGTAVMFGQEVKKDAAKPAATKEVKTTTTTTTKEATKPATTKEVKTTTTTKKEAAKPADTKTEPAKK